VLQWLQTRWRLWAAFTPIRMHAARLVKPIPLPPLKTAVLQMRLILRVGAAREFSWDVQCHRLDSPGALISRVRGPLVCCLRTAAGWAGRTTPEPSAHLTAEWARWRRLLNGTQSSGCKLRVLDVGTFENRCFSQHCSRAVFRTCRPHATFASAPDRYDAVRASVDALCMDTNPRGTGVLKADFVEWGFRVFNTTALKMSLPRSRRGSERRESVDDMSPPQPEPFDCVVRFPCLHTW